MDDSSIGKSLGQPVMMLNDHNQLIDSLFATYFYLLAEIILEHILGKYHIHHCYIE